MTITRVARFLNRTAEHHPDETYGMTTFGQSVLYQDTSKNKTHNIIYNTVYSRFYSLLIYDFTL